MFIILPSPYLTLALVAALLFLSSQAYVLFLRFLTYATSTYFRRVHVVGLDRVPAAALGPVLLCPNHANMVVDPFLVVSQCFRRGRRPFIWAKGSLFRHPVTRWLMTALGGVPVFRPHKLSTARQDADTAAPLTPAEAAAATQRMFERTWNVLADGHAMVLFPEGTSYTRPNMLPLRTGVVRAAAGFVRHHKQALPIIPVGLTYARKDAFRSDVVLEFGEPMVLTPEGVETEEFRADERKEIKRWTDELRERMGKVTLNAETFDTIRAARSMQRMYGSSGAVVAEDRQVRMTQAIVDMLEKGEENEMKEVKEAVLQHEDELKRWGLQRLDDMLRVEWRALTQPLLERVVYFAALLPLGVVGVLVNAPFYWLGAKLDAATTDVESKSTMKLVAVALCIPVQWVIFTATAWLVGGTLWAYAVMISLPVVLHVHLHLRDEAEAILDHLRLLYFRFMYPEHLEAVCAEHQKLVTTVSALIKQHVDPCVAASIQKSIDIADNSPKHDSTHRVHPFPTMAQPLSAPA